MGYSDGMITGAVGMGDISSALSIGSLDLGTLITTGGSQGKTNKWAYHKPVRDDSPTTLTDARMAATNCGLSPVTLTKVKAMSLGWMTGGTYTQEACLQEVQEWPYAYPRGISQTPKEWFRMLDFQGYNTAAIAPDQWRYVNLPTSTLARYSNLTLTTTTRNTPNDFVFSPRINSREDYLTDSNFLYQNFSCMFGYGSTERFNWKTGMEIPISAVTSLSGSWRVGLAVWVPNYPISGTQTGAWAIFASRMTLADYYNNGPATASNGSPYNLGQALCPDFGTNRYALQLMYNYVSSVDYAEFPCIPILAKDLWYDATPSSFMFKPASDTIIYSMPSGTWFSLSFGEEPEPIYYSLSYPSTSSQISAVITNIDESDSHTFEYEMVRVVNGTTTTSTGTAMNMAAGESRTLGAVPIVTGQVNTITVTVISQS